MGGDSEYEPKDSRNVTGEAHTPDGRWSGDKQPRGHGGEYEPRDSRNVTGTASTPDGRWTNTDGAPPAGVPDENPADAQEAAVQSQDGTARRGPTAAERPGVSEDRRGPGQK